MRPVFDIEREEPELWHMAMSVWREINSGMGCGIYRALIDYCTVMGIDDPRLRRLYLDIMKRAVPKRTKPEKRAKA